MQCCNSQQQSRLTKQSCNAVQGRVAEQVCSNLEQLAGHLQSLPQQAKTVAASIQQVCLAPVTLSFWLVCLDEMVKSAPASSTFFVELKLKAP